MEKVVLDLSLENFEVRDMGKSQQEPRHGDHKPGYTW